MISKINNYCLKRIITFLPLNKTLEIIKYSKKILKKLDFNQNCMKYYKILKIIEEINFFEFHNKDYLFHLVRNTEEEDIKCFLSIKQLIQRQHFENEIFLPLDGEGGDELFEDYLKLKYLQYNKRKNLKLIINSDIKLSKKNEEKLFSIFKKEKTKLFLQIQNENKIINWFLKNWEGDIYSLSFMKELENNLLEKVLKTKSINLISELNIQCSIKGKDRDLLFKTFLPNCINLKKILLWDFPEKSENYNNFLINSQQLEHIIIDFPKISSMDTLNYIINDNNVILKLEMFFSLDFEADKTYKMDFNYIKKLKNLNYLEIQFDGDGKIIPIELENGLNSLKNLEILKIRQDGVFSFVGGINNLRIPSLKEIDFFLDEIDLKTIIDYHKNLKKMKIHYLNDIDKVKFSNNLENVILTLNSEKLLLNLFKQIQKEPINLIELNIRIEWILGCLTINGFNQLAKCFLKLHNLKKLVIQTIRRDKRKNVNWIKNFKYLKNIIYFELMYYELTIKDLELFISSIENLEFLIEIKFWDNKFESKEIHKLIKTKKFPQSLKNFNLLSNLKDDKINNNSEENEEIESENEDEESEMSEYKEINEYEYPIFD